MYIFVSLIGKNDFNSQDVFDVQVDMLDAFDCNFTKTEKEYNLLLNSGMFWVAYPELTGVWDKDKKVINRL